MAAVHRLTARRDVGPVIGSAIRAALAGSGPSLIVVQAPSGAGKSHVLREVLAAATERALSATAVEASTARPYGVATELLGVPRPARIPDRYDDVLLARLDELVGAGPLVLAVDDLHRADAESLAVLDQIVSAAGSVPVAVLVAVRLPVERDDVVRLLARDGVLRCDLPPFDELDLDVLVHEHTGAWPGPGLRALLAPVAGNALHVLSVVDGLVAAGAASGDRIDVDIAGTAIPATLAESISVTVNRLQGNEVDAARALAVLGAPSTVDDIAGLLDVPPMSLLGPVQRLLDAGLVVEVAERVGFAQEAYRDAVYDAAPAPLRRLLHSAAGARSRSVERARHVIASGSGADDVLAALREAADDLDHAPGVTAELLAGVTPGADPAQAAAAALTVTRARALARAGRPRRAGELAREAQALTSDPAVLTELRRVELFSLSTRAEVPEALELIHAMLQDPLPERPRRILQDHRTFLRLLGGIGPVPIQPYAADPADLGLNALVAEALRRCLLGDTGVALEYAWTASRRYLSDDLDPNEGQSVDVWPPFVELQHSGPDAARESLREVIRLRDERGATWQTSNHQGIAASIDALAGRLDDAVAQVDASLESAARSDIGWIAQQVGLRILLDVLRGDGASAARRLARWDADPGVVPFGLPQLERARMLILEAERRYDESAQVAAAMWGEGIERRNYAWAGAVAPEVARVALRAADDELRLRVHRDLTARPEPAGVPIRNARRLALALTGPAYAEVPAVAADVARRAGEYGDGLLRLQAGEEAAVATALTGSRDDARALARQAIALAEEFGARGVAARIAGRMRSAGVRLGSTATRGRPDHGWESLTPTERLIVDHVARGLPGPDIARQLHLSPRTVQTHVSHALAKLGVANRVELAAYAVSRGGTPPPVVA